MRNYGKAQQIQIEVQALLDKEKRDLKQLGVSEEKIKKLSDEFYQEAIQQPYTTNSSYVLNKLIEYKNQLAVQTPSEQLLEEMIADLKEQLESTSDDTISDEIIQEIKFRENQLQQLIIKNNTI